MLLHSFLDVMPKAGQICMCDVESGGKQRRLQEREGIERSLSKCGFSFVKFEYSTDSPKGNSAEWPLLGLPRET